MGDVTKHCASLTTVNWHCSFDLIHRTSDQWLNVIPSQMGRVDRRFPRYHSDVANLAFSFSLDFWFIAGLCSPEKIKHKFYAAKPYHCAKFL